MSLNKLVHLSSEFYPLFKKGGLGDFLYSFTKELTRSSYTNIVILPYYEKVPYKVEHNYYFDMDYNGISLKTTASTLMIDNVKVVLITNDIIESIDYRFSAPYWEEPNILPLIVFSKAALEYLSLYEKDVNIIYTHDWQTAGIHLFPEEKKKLKSKYIAFIHNYEHQGVIKERQLNYLPSESQLICQKIIQDYKSITLSSVHIHYSDQVITVSSNYLNEILNNEVSHKNNYVLQKNKKKAIGIVNGVDYETWSPKSDPYLAGNLQLRENFKKFKQLNKENILKHLHIDFNSDTMLFSFNSRLTFQKGLSLILTNSQYDYNIDYFKKIAQLNAVFVIHGSADESSARYIEDCKKIIRDLKIKNIFLMTPYSEAFAHQLIAGSDCLLHPSMFEPCGLTQLYALKYGTIPLVTNSGGLKETIINYDEKSTSAGYGFIMEEKSHTSLYETIFKAYDLFQKKETWSCLQQNALKQDFSWDKSILKHINVINKLI